MAVPILRQDCLKDAEVQIALRHLHDLIDVFPADLRTVERLCRSRLGGAQVHSARDFWDAVGQLSDYIQQHEI